jgi:hypothetical protein
MIRRDRPPSARQCVLFALAVVAVLFRIAAPPGTMVAATERGAALVICTGHGPMSDMTSPAKAPASKAHSDGGCEFAANTAHALTSDSLAFVGSSSWSATALPQPVVLETVGSGLAAPPPPSQAPPVLAV